MPYVNPKNPPQPADPEPRRYRDGRLINPEHTTEHTHACDSWEPDVEATER